MVEITRYEDDLAELRLKFAKVDVKDPVSIQKWFAEHSYLSTADHARISGRSNHWIRKLKRLAHIKGKTPANLPKSTRRKTVDALVAPDNWDDPIWLEKVAKTHTVSSIARVTGVSPRTLRRRFQKYGIKSLGKKSLDPKNPCFSYAWCHEYYVVRRWTQAQCAQAAGICQQAFANWLNKLGIPVRSTHEAQKNSDTKIWVRKTIHQLENQEIVRRVFLRSDHIHVRFRNYFWESYYIEKPKGKRRIPHSFSITKSEARLDKVPVPYLEYESSIDGSELYPAHITLRKKDWQKASFLERRLALHNFTRVINRRGWIWPKYPDYVIENDLTRLKESNQAKFIKKGVFIAHPIYGKREIAGFRIIEHFFGLTELWEEIFRSPKRTMQMFNKLCEKKMQVNMHNIIRIACHNHPAIKIKVYDPGVFIWLFRRLGIKGTVLDLYPSNGHHAIACAIAGLKYMAVPNEKFENAINNGFADFLGLDYEPYDGRKVDLILSNNDFKDVDIDLAMGYADKAKNILHFVSRKHKSSTQASYTPSKIIQIKTSIYRALPDYLFVF